MVKFVPFIAIKLMILLTMMLIFSLSVLNIYSGDKFFIFTLILGIVFILFIRKKYCCFDVDSRQLTIAGDLKLKQINLIDIMYIKVSEYPLSKGKYLATVHMGKWLDYYSVSDNAGKIKMFAENNAIRREITSFDVIYWLKEP